MESKLLHYIAGHFADLDITAFDYEGIMLKPCKAESALQNLLLNRNKLMRKVRGGGVNRKYDVY